MPNYDYECSACSYREEIFQRITEDPITTCPHCGKETFHRIVTGGAGVLYKGEGWYVTDYSKKSSGGKESTSSSTSASSAPTPPAPPSSGSGSSGSASE